MRAGDGDRLAAERALSLIAAAEAACDGEGIDALLDRFGKADLRACADAFAAVGAAAIARSLHRVVARLPDRPEKLLDDVDELIKAREGYDEESIAEFVGRRSTPSAELPTTGPVLDDRTV